MSDKKFGELKKLNMRDAWRIEPRDFTPWLHDNISVLGNALGMTLHAKSTEVAIGDFSLDLLAEDDNERKVAIENQFRRTDHSHLGQLLTYAAGCDADVLVWVTETVRDEHRAAVEWLNRKTDTDTEFYLVKVEVLQIDDSPLACQFVSVVAPNKWQKEVHQQAATIAAAHGPYFQRFIDELVEKGFAFKPRRHRDSTHRRQFPSGIRHWRYVHEFWNNNARVFLRFFDEDKATIETLHEKLSARKQTIEKNGGGSMKWEGPKTIGVSRPSIITDSEESLAEIRKWAVEQMFKLAEAIPPAMLQEIAAELDAEESEE